MHCKLRIEGRQPEALQAAGDRWPSECGSRELGTPSIEVGSRGHQSSGPEERSTRVTKALARLCGWQFQGLGDRRRSKTDRRRRRGRLGSCAQQAEHAYAAGRKAGPASRALRQHAGGMHKVSYGSPLRRTLDWPDLVILRLRGPAMRFDLRTTWSRHTRMLLVLCLLIASPLPILIAR